MGGGIRHVPALLATLLREQSKEVPKLADYAKKLGIGAIHKRLGFLLQRDHSDQTALIEACRENLSAGYAKLDPALPADRLITTWRVWVPASELREARP